MTREWRALWVMVVALFLLLCLTRCSPAPQPQGQLPIPSGRGPEQHWTFVPMTGGPNMWTSCVKGDRLYLISNQAWRSSDMPASGTVSVSAGGCK